LARLFPQAPKVFILAGIPIPATMNVVTQRPVLTSDQHSVGSTAHRVYDAPVIVGLDVHKLVPKYDLGVRRHAWDVAL